VSAIFIGENRTRAPTRTYTRSNSVQTHTLYIYMHSFVPIYRVYNCIVLRANTGNSVSPYYPRDRVRNRYVLFIRVHDSHYYTLYVHVRRRLIVVAVLLYRAMRKTQKREFSTDVVVLRNSNSKYSNTLIDNFTMGFFRDFSKIRLDSLHSE